MNDSNTKKCRIAVDALGGDFAPKHEIIGSLNALKESNDFELILVGNKDKILQTAKDENLSIDENIIYHAPEIINMHDKPIDAIKNKPNSSIVVSAKLVKENKADAFVSAGNTGAVAAVSTLLMGRLPNVERPTIGSFFPSKNNATFVFDVGAFVDVKPNHLFGYAILANIFVKELYNIENPSIALLSVGEEDEKGNKLVKETAQLLRNSNLNFIGNVEGRDILNGKCNIILCDGFVGNILLKFGESVPGFMKHLLKQHADKNIFEKIKIGLFKNTLKKALSPLNPDLYGGVPLLGINGITIIGHGSSSPLAIKNMILRAKEMYNKNLLSKFEDSLKNYAEKK
ncbi:phosphate acyltransferase PlsX [Stygiobacter electus]|jgi:glycerol-3-phosphate acyltransferase PlsX|uniref:Phosphate acyltransferase n=1 Tax=Stygiobacter electus TaxID=3032292 RepID=A0AAE3P1S2_9BACT|nr:phosphate acyltransferase PlsX [Stygiobacter electus]MDF1612489.1 phosphate acyltransferase PlsX [Stygiobacter electus]